MLGSRSENRGAATGAGTLTSSARAGGDIDQSGPATAANITRFKEQKYRYLVVSRERTKPSAKTSPKTHKSQTAMLRASKLQTEPSDYPRYHRLIAPLSTMTFAT
jgi:hypothetical protein